MSLMKNEKTKFAAGMLQLLNKLNHKPIKIMEVCGTHTAAILKSGIKQLLPKWISLVSGPGCPVCVTTNGFIEAAAVYSRYPDTIVLTFGDMLRVPGSLTSLEQERARGADIRVIYSPLEGIAIARDNPEKKIIYLAVGFETTAPLTAALILTAQQQCVRNLFVNTGHKLITTGLRELIKANKLKADAYILPGHVAVVTGLSPFTFLAEEFQLPAVICGFEPVDIVQAIYTLVEQLIQGQPAVSNQYNSVVRPKGNSRAQEIVNEIFTVNNTSWRGIGEVNNSGLVLKSKYKDFAAEYNFTALADYEEPCGCRCGDVICGKIKPPNCEQFGRRCVPDTPLGPCMVSQEGTCFLWFIYGDGGW